MVCSQRVKPFWGFMNLELGQGIILVERDVIIDSTICLSMCGV